MKTTPNQAAAQLHEFLADAESEAEARKILTDEGVDVDAFVARLAAARSGQDATTAKIGGLGKLAARTQEEIRSFLSRFGAGEDSGLPAGAFARSGDKSAKRPSRGPQNSSSPSGEKK